MRRQLVPALGILLVFTVLTGLAYPFLVTGIAQAAFADRADGSFIERDGEVVGSRWIGQSFEGEEYFHPRPSATGYSPGLPADVEGGPAYAAGSNEGPTSERFLDGEDDPETPDVDESTTDGVDDRVRAYRELNGLGDDAPVPVDAVTGSASSLDPHISVANARIQARRVAAARDLDVDDVLDLVDVHTDGRSLWFLGEPGVNVLELNLALDERVTGE
jgi:K+-transporting ATPase ATPase C chain